MISSFIAYLFRYELSDKKEGDASIQILNKGTEQEVIFVSGRLNTFGPDGKASYIDYVVDMNGFRLLKKTVSYISPLTLKTLVG